MDGLFRGKVLFLGLCLVCTAPQLLRRLADLAVATAAHKKAGARPASKARIVSCLEIPGPTDGATPATQAGIVGFLLVLGGGGTCSYRRARIARVIANTSTGRGPRLEAVFG